VEQHQIAPVGHMAAAQDKRLLDEEMGEYEYARWTRLPRLGGKSLITCPSATKDFRPTFPSPRTWPPARLLVLLYADRAHQVPRISADHRQEHSVMYPIDLLKVRLSPSLRRRRYEELRY